MIVICERGVSVLRARWACSQGRKSRVYEPQNRFRAPEIVSSFAGCQLEQFGVRAYAISYCSIGMSTVLKSITPARGNGSRGQFWRVNS
eukprot:5758801-Prymnesium_polylepis.1